MRLFLCAAQKANSPLNGRYNVERNASYGAARDLIDSGIAGCVGLSGLFFYPSLLLYACTLTAPHQTHGSPGNTHTEFILHGASGISPTPCGHASPTFNA